MDLELAGKHVLISGATSGIGLETARLLHDHGVRLTLIGRNQAMLASLERELGARVFGVDITSDTAVGQVFEQIETLDGLVNCAGISKLDDALNVRGADIDALLSTNARATAILSREAARLMIANDTPGSIVNVSSQASLVALRGHLGYCASKAAIDAMTRVLCLELGAHGIRVNSVNPTVTLTPMAERAWSEPAKRDPMLAAIPLGRFATPQEVALPIAFLLSDAAAMISGISLPIDGGYTCH
nr:SDR family oxidoreductase [uncultured Halomonas sp.]